MPEFPVIAGMGVFSICKFPNHQIFLRFAAQMVVVAQLVRALDCGSRGRGFEPRHPPIFNLLRFSYLFHTLFR